MSLEAGFARTVVELHLIIGIIIILAQEIIAQGISKAHAQLKFSHISCYTRYLLFHLY